VYVNRLITISDNRSKICDIGILSTKLSTVKFECRRHLMNLFSQGADLRFQLIDSFLLLWTGSAECFSSFHKRFVCVHLHNDIYHPNINKINSVSNML
jgi:hypothetical protein